MSKNNGGPAFPEVSTNVSYSQDSDYRYADVQSFGGMTLRQYYAGKALQGLLADGSSGLKGQIDATADFAWSLAAAMIDREPSP
ncbi:MAG TPA: hypothetical protein VM621_10405 [Luteibacter sp.]|uniref:hypothetical protein n=1 Tax=Luteibacter sp. TaxID=1886636 RepID=UPI002BF0EE1A|nr:hypothetical protein [Luteibacter sp.]HVI55450.1 hypothetical protein [Luteibacter sp.]